MSSEDNDSQHEQPTAEGLTVEELTVVEELTAEESGTEESAAEPAAAVEGLSPLLTRRAARQARSQVETGTVNEAGVENAAVIPKTEKLTITELMAENLPAPKAAAYQPKRRPFYLMILVPLLLFISLVGWNFASPLGSSPDAEYHIASIWCGAGDRPGLCEPGKDDTSKKVPDTIFDSWVLDSRPHNEREHGWFLCYWGGKDPSCQNDWINSQPHQLQDTTRVNFGRDAQYVGFYYTAMSPLASDNVYLSIWSMRILNAFLFVLMGTLLYLALPLARRAGLLLTWAVAAVPNIMFFIPSTNPSSWAIIGVPAAFFGALGFMETTGRRRVFLGILAAVGALLAASARADGAVYSALAMLIALVLQARRGKEFWKPLLWPGLAAAGAIVIYLLYPINIAVNGLSADADAGRDHNLQLLVKNIIETPIDLWAEAFAGAPLGPLEIGLPRGVMFPMLVVLGVTLGFVLRFGGRRRNVAALLTLGALMFFPVYVLQRDGLPVGQSVQARYLIPLAVLFLAVMFYTKTKQTLQAKGGYLAIIFILINLAHLFAIYRVMTHYSSLGDKSWWWPDFPLAPRELMLGTLAAFSLALLIALYGVMRLRRVVNAENETEKALLQVKEQPQAAAPPPAFINMGTGMITLGDSEPTNLLPTRPGSASE